MVGQIIVLENYNLLTILCDREETELICYDLVHRVSNCENLNANSKLFL